MSGLSPLPGTYAFILQSTSARDLPVGRLGILPLRPGWYLYLGSAFGPGGIQARCRHHLREAARPHWHIDYLRAATRPYEIWYTLDPRRLEHDWARVAGRARGVSVPLRGFGATDCACNTHLLFQEHPPSLVNFRCRLARRLPGQVRIARWPVPSFRDV